MTDAEYRLHRFMTNYNSTTYLWNVLSKRALCFTSSIVWNSVRPLQIVKLRNRERSTDLTWPNESSGNKPKANIREIHSDSSIALSILSCFLFHETARDFRHSLWMREPLLAVRSVKIGSRSENVQSKEMTGPGMRRIEWIEWRVVWPVAIPTPNVEYPLGRNHGWGYQSKEGVILHTGLPVFLANRRRIHCERYNCVGLEKFQSKKHFPYRFLPDHHSAGLEWRIAFVWSSTSLCLTTEIHWPAKCARVH